MDSELFYIAVLVFFVAGIIKGTVGIGLPTIVISVLSIFADPRWAMSMVLMTIFASNLWQFCRAKTAKKQALNYWPLMLLLVAFNYGVSRYSFGTDTRNILLALGVVVILFALGNLIKKPPPLPQQWDKAAQVLAGSAAGVLGGLTTIWGPPMVVYLLSKRLHKEVFILVSGAILTVGSLPLLLSYRQVGLLPDSTLIGSAVLMAPAIAGMYLGERLRQNIDTERFTKLLLLMFLVLGINLIRRAVFP